MSICAGVFLACAYLLYANGKYVRRARALKWCVHARLFTPKEKQKEAEKWILSRQVKADRICGFSYSAPGKGTCSPQRLSLLISEVASRLSSGSPVEHAWQKTWSRFPEFGDMGNIHNGCVPSGLVAACDVPSWKSCMKEKYRRLKNRSDRVGKHCDYPVRALISAHTVTACTRRRACRAVVSACQFTSYLGAPLAEVLERIADGVDDSICAEDARRVAQSGPKVSARILTALPLLGVIAAQILGAHPLSRFVDGGVGTGCAVVGITCICSSWLISRRMLTNIRHDNNDVLDPAIMADLAVSGLESGASIPAVLVALAHAVGLDELARIGRELPLGASWTSAWNSFPSEAIILKDSLHAAWEAGVAPTPLLERAAAHVRSRRLADAKSKAEKIAVRLVIPLGALLLPAFIALGVVPLIMHVGGGMGDLIP